MGIGYPREIMNVPELQKLLTDAIDRDKMMKSVTEAEEQKKRAAEDEGQEGGGGGRRRSSRSRRLLTEQKL
jgi:hypothetical protein